MMINETEILIQIDAFRKKHDNMHESTFGRLALKDPNFVGDLRSGKGNPTLRKLQRVRAWMRKKDKELLKSLQPELNLNSVEDLL